MDFPTKMADIDITSESAECSNVKSDTEGNLNSKALVPESFTALVTHQLSSPVIPSSDAPEANLSYTSGSSSTDSNALIIINSVEMNDTESDLLQMQNESFTALETHQLSSTVIPSSDALEANSTDSKALLMNYYAEKNDTKSDILQMQKELEADKGIPSEKGSLPNNKKINKFRHVVTENQERINFLLQAANYLNNVDNASNFTNESASLGSLASAIGRKCVLRMSPGLKRQLCKGCGSPMLPALSSKYRLRNNREKHLVVTCNKCKTIKRFVTNPNYALWTDKPESNI